VELLLVLEWNTLIQEENNMKKGRNSLERVTGLTAQEVSGMKAGAMQMGGEKIPNRSRTVVVQKDRLSLSHDTATSFEVMVKYIAKAIKDRREEVENALIVTGAPVSVRNLNPSRFNAYVENQLTRRDSNGQAFRQLMTALVSGLYGRQLDNDKFFKMAESKASAIGDDELSSETNNIIALQPLPLQPIEQTKKDQNILPYAKNSTGGVDQTKSDKDWGGILSGSAQVITAVGGVLGLFTGGNQVSEGQSNFDQYNQQNGGMPPVKEKKSWIWVVVALVVVGVAIALIVKFGKKNN